MKEGLRSRALICIGIPSAVLESVCAENNENYGKFLGLSEYPMPEAKTPDF